MTALATLKDRATLIHNACEECGLDNFGDTWFFEHIDELLTRLASEAALSAEGLFGAEAMITAALVKRLRHIELIKQHPEILEEQVNVAAVIVGLPRTGSTMLHRMLSSAPGMTAVRWYEAQNYVPLPDEQQEDPTPRLEAAQQILDYMLLKIPELMSIHPMSIDQADEEVIILGQLFSSTMIEASYFVPGYAMWLTEQSAVHAYNDLYQVLQSLQWQNPARKGKRWVLKTPGHLMALDVLLDRFPAAKIVMTHREPVQTVPSYCSMQRSLYSMGSDEISNEMIGQYWPERLQELMQMFMEVRKTGNNEERFIDVYYQELLKDPVGQGMNILRAANARNETSESAMQTWVDDNQRGERQAHTYSAAEFGLSEAGVEQQFEAYRKTYF